MFRSPFLLAMLFLLPTPASTQDTADSAASFSWSHLRRNLPDEPWARWFGGVDWDGDGDVDLLGMTGPSEPVSGLIEPAIFLHSNDGHARFEESLRLTTETTVWTAALGDLDGDGDPDALIGGGFWGAPALRWVENDGQGGGALRDTEVLDEGFVQAIELADVDVDGDLDAIVLTTTGRWLARALGGGHFAPDLERIGTASGATYPPIVEDLDGDGFVDLAFYAGGVEVYRNDGTGAFSLIGTYPYVAPMFFARGDIDGDGDIDLITGRVEVPSLDFLIAIHLNDGTGQFTVTTDRAAPRAEFPAALVPRDVDGDGDLDLLLGEVLLVNDGAGFFQEQAGHWPDSRLGVIDGDLADDYDGDGDVDLVLAPSNRVLLGDGTGSFFDPVEDPAPGTFSSPSALVDVEPDGDLDVFVCDDQTRLFLNDGRGVFSEDPGALPPNSGGGDMQAGDVDGDGDVDVVLGPCRLVLNDGTGHFTDASASCWPGELFSQEVDLGDLDGDGDLDLYVSRAGPSLGYEGGYTPWPDSLWLNDGAGCFSIASSLLPPNHAITLAADLGDVDGDGDLDVLTSAGSLFLGDGAGGFTDATSDVEILWGGEDVKLVDLDGDGDLDAYFGCPGATDQIVLNDGQGRFPDPQIIPPSSKQVSFHDFDEDGDLDLVSGVFHKPRPRSGWIEYLEIHENDGSGGFTRVAIPRTSSLYHAVGDLDHDGDLDIFNGYRVFFNQRRSLSWRRAADLARPHFLDLAGTPGASALLFASSGLGTPVSSVHGLRQLDPHGFLFARHVRLDAEGRGEFHVHVPDDPALVGVCVYWQALIGAPLRWSNYERTTISDF